MYVFLSYRLQIFKELIKCTHEFCEEQNIALKALFKDELDKCLKLCKASDKKLNTLEEEERKKIKECFRENNCKSPMEHIKANRETPEFKAMKECAEEKCKEQFNKIKEFDPSIDQ